MRNEMAQNTKTTARSASDPSVREMQQTEVTGTNPAGEQIELVVVVLTEPEKGSADRK